MNPGQHDKDPHQFATTQWSIIALAANRDDQAQAQAIATLCQSYWFPLYAFVRRRGHEPADAEDLVQGFFAHILQGDFFGKPTAERGRFRTFVLASLKNYLINEHEHATAAKRGGKAKLLSLDTEQGESRLAREPAASLTPERCFERQWALTVIESAMRKIEAEYALAGKQQHLEALKGALTGEGNVDYAAVCPQLNLSADAARQAVRRLRQRFKMLIQLEVLQTVCDSGEGEDELKLLLAALAAS